MWRELKVKLGGEEWPEKGSRGPKRDSVTETRIEKHFKKKSHIERKKGRCWNIHIFIFIHWLY